MADVFCIVEKHGTLKQPTTKTELNASLAYNNSQAHSIRYVAYENGPVDLSGLGVTASFMKSNNETVEPILGTITDNVAEVILPASCYVTPGRFRFTMNLTKPTPTTGIDAFSTSVAYAKGDLVVYSGVVYRFTAAHAAGAWIGTDAVPDCASRTIMWVEGMVERNSTSTIIDPGTPVGNIDTAIGNAQAAAALASAAATSATSAASAATTAAQNANVANDVINSVESLVDYDYSTPYEQAENPSQTGWQYKTGIVRTGETITLNKSTGSTNKIRIRISGPVQLAATTGTIQGWTNGLALKDGHVYKTMVRLISGTSNYDDNTLNRAPYCYAYIIGTSNDATSGNHLTRKSDGIAMTRFTADGTKTYALALYLDDSKWRFTNAKFVVTLEDITESEELGKKLPEKPTTDGTYVLKCTVASGTVTYSWVAET